MATVWINPGYGQKGFSDKELKDITISVIVLSLAFTIIYDLYQLYFSLFTREKQKTHYLYSI